jgi:hypothetical protein
MSERPYFSFGTVELESEVNQHWNDLPILRMLQQELSQRSKPKARALLERVEERVATLSRDGRAPGPKGNSARSTRSHATSEDRVSKAEREAAAAQEKLRELQAQLEAMQDADYALLGLSPTAPDYVLQATMRALRKRFHPDSQHGASDKERRASELQLQSLEAAFHRVMAKRQEAGS